MILYEQETFVSKMMQRFFICYKFAKFTCSFMKQIKRYCWKWQKGLVYERADKHVE